MNFRYHPEDIASALCGWVGSGPEEREDVLSALYHLDSIRQNKYNPDYWRSFWKVLEDIVDSTYLPF